MALLGTAKQLYHRPLDQLDAVPIPDTEGATSPFFSPDGQWIGFTIDEDAASRTDHSTTIKKVRLVGGPSQTVCDLPDHALWTDLRPAWSDDDTIWLAGGDGLYRVAATGGVPELVTDDIEVQHPLPLPGGRGLLFQTRPPGGGTSIAVYALDTGAHRILTDGNRPWFVDSGHVVFSRGDIVWALPFDVDRSEATGEPVPVLEGVWSGRRRGFGDDIQGHQMFVGLDGTLVYVPADRPSDARTLVWVNREGKEEPVAAPQRGYSNPRLSPDGNLVATEIEGDIWVYDLARSTETRLTTHPSRDGGPLWSTDGRFVLFGSPRNRADGGREVFRKAADGTGEVEQLSAEPERSMWPSSRTRDGPLVVNELDRVGGTSFNIGLMTEAGRWTPLLETRAPEYYPRVSPDDRWLASASHGPGGRTLFVYPFPDVTAGR